MKRRNTQKSDNLFLYSKLVKEGFDISTLLKFSNKQLVTLASRVLKEATIEFDNDNKDDLEKLATTTYPKETVEVNPDGTVKVEMNDDDLTEELELTKDNKPIVPVQKDIDGQVSDQEILEKSKNEFDMYETIMYGGAGDFDATSFYNPDAGGFSTSQGPADSYYSTDNKENLIGAGTGQDEGQYTGNAKYLDTPSFHNPDASGFDSEGPRDSYGQYDSYEGGFAGELNEFEGAPEPRYSFRNPVASGHQSEGPRGHSSGLHEQGEDAEEDSAQSLEKMSGYDKYAGNTVGNEDGPSNYGSNPKAGGDGMGIFESIYQEELNEKFASKAQARLFYAKSKEPGKEGEKFKEYADEFAADTNFDTIPEKVKKKKKKVKNESIDRGVVENWLMGLVEKYERPSMTKEQLLQTINEIAVMNAPAPVRTPTRTKPGTKPGKPDRKNPYKPKHKPNPKAEDADSDIEDAKYELPAWMDFDTLFIKNEEA